MADIIRRDPFVGMRHIMDRLFDDSFFRPVHANGFDEGTLPVDISETDGALQVRASLPGFTAEDIDVQVHEGVLSINAKHVEESKTHDVHYYRRERQLGSLSRRIALPGVVRDAEVAADLAEGVLTLTIPLPEQAKPKQIEIHGS